MKENFKSGFIAVLGRPNVGKSSLVNALIGSKISIISPIPQTTRHQIKAILNTKDAQLVFVDTPGVHSFRDKLTSHLNVVAKNSIEGCDLILYVVDVVRKIGKEEEKIIDIVVNSKVKTIMVLNKVDLGIKYLNDYVDLWRQRSEAEPKENLLYYMPTSAIKGTNIDELRKILIEYTPTAHPFYEKDATTDFPLKFRIADIIREKLFLTLKKEIPHSLAVEVESIENRKRKKYIVVNIYVQRPSQKKIVVGRKGEKLKEIGSLARGEIEDIFNKKVFLDIWVKVFSDWQKSPRVLKELGYWWG